MQLSEGPLSAPPDRMQALRDAFRRAGFDLPHLQAALHVGEELSSRPGDIPIFERRLRGGSPFDTLARLFAASLPVPEVHLARALSPMTAAELEAMGMVAVEAGEVVPRLRVTPHGDLLIASDRALAGGEPAPQHVTGLNAPAGLLASLTVRRHSRRTLDLGTGNGIQALLASRHSDQVVATDVNPRALRFAEFNAALNGVANIEFREGSLYEPVPGEAFDIIVSNPPYVISPEFTYVYRDSGGEPGAICQAVVEGAPAALAEGGYLQVLVSWPVAGREAPDLVPRSWLGPGVDAWILCHGTEDPLTHAAKWNPAFGDADASRRAEVVDSWVAYDAEHGIDEIAFGAVVLRRRTPPPANLTWVTDLHSGQGSAGPQIERAFRARLELASMNDDDLLESRFRLVPEHRLEQVAHFNGEQWQVQSATLALTEGVTFRGEIDGYLAAVLGALTGRVTLREAVVMGAQAISMPEGDLRTAAARSAEMCRTLYGLGFLSRTGEMD